MSGCEMETVVVSRAKEVLASGRMDSSLAKYEIRMTRGRFLDKWTARELYRNGTLRARNLRRMQLHYMRYRWQRVERDKRIVAALAGWFGVEW